MEMRFFLKSSVVCGVPIVPIGRQQFDDLNAAHSTLVAALAIEEKYDLLVENYAALERALLSATLSHAMWRSPSYADALDLHLEITRHVVNLLTAARMYVDQAPQDVRAAVPGDPSALETAKGWFSAEYDAHPEYRFMETLRNFAQHQGLPVHLIRKGGRWTSLDEDGVLEYGIDLESHKERLCAGGRIKASVRDELPPKVNLKASIRRYVESLSQVHERARAFVDSSARSARSVLDEAHGLYSKHAPPTSVDLRAFQVGPDDVETSIPLLVDWDDLRQELVKRNRQLANLGRWVISGRTSRT